MSFAAYFSNEQPNYIINQFGMNPLHPTGHGGGKGTEYSILEGPGGGAPWGLPYTEGYTSEDRSRPEREWNKGPLRTTVDPITQHSTNRTNKSITNKFIPHMHLREAGDVLQNEFMMMRREIDSSEAPSDERPVHYLG